MYLSFLLFLCLLTHIVFSCASLAFCDFLDTDDDTFMQHAPNEPSTPPRAAAIANQSFATPNNQYIGHQQAQSVPASYQLSTNMSMPSGFTNVGSSSAEFLRDLQSGGSSWAAQTNYGTPIASAIRSAPNSLLPLTLPPPSLPSFRSPAKEYYFKNMDKFNTADYTAAMKAEAQSEEAAARSTREAAKLKAASALELFGHAALNLTSSLTAENRDDGGVKQTPPSNKRARGW